MIPIKDSASIATMEEGGKLLASMFQEIAPAVKAGMDTLTLDRMIDAALTRRAMTSMSKGYKGYKHSSCISRNDEVVHGIPSATKILRDGDFVKIDVCARYQGFCVDMTRMFFVGVASEQAQEIAVAAQAALDKGIAAARAGSYVSDISHAIQREVEARGFSVVRAFAGHGIGKKMHEEPEILNYGKPGRGEQLKPGMAFALEPMITAGSYEVYVERDGWTAKTADKSIAAHVEDTIVITESDPIIVTRISSAPESESTRL